jgi:hypothetical protein
MPTIDPELPPARATLGPQPPLSPTSSAPPAPPPSPTHVHITRLLCSGLGRIKGKRGSSPGRKKGRGQKVVVPATASSNATGGGRRFLALFAAAPSSAWRGRGPRPSSSRCKARAAEARRRLLGVAVRWQREKSTAATRRLAESTGGREEVRGGERADTRQGFVGGEPMPI